LPLDTPLDILGYPELDLSLSADQPLALVAVRLCDVAPDGASTLVSWGLLNLTHRDSHEFPQPLEPGQRYRVTVQLNVIGHRLAAGHRWRVAISPTYARHAWPSPEPVTLTVYTGPESRLRLPERRGHPGDDALPPFLPAETAAPLALTHLRLPQTSKTICSDLVAGTTEYRIEDDSGRVRHDGSGMEVDDRVVERYTVRDGSPLSMKVHIERAIELQREAWRARVETTSVMTADATHFHVSTHLDAYEGDTRVFTSSWTRTIPRQLV